ncbi:MAG: hypothetical protein [Arizlama microvirus]|nr:MAG: hypothetical protein [Arizlama microvirus]
MDPALVAGGMQLLGGLLGGGARKKAAKKAAADLSRWANEAVQAAGRDMTRVVEYRKDDEARLAANQRSGVDLAKLRDEAQAAGFNPLTVLNTVGAGYVREDVPTLTTPFIAEADAYWNKANLRAGGQAAVIDAAGYVGDAVGAAGAAYFGQANEMARQINDRAMLDAMARPNVSMSPTSAPFGGKATTRVAMGASGSPSSPFFGTVDRERVIAPMTNSPGYFEMNNPLTFGRNIYMPGDGEPWGLDELGTAVIFGGPQVFMAGVDALTRDENSLTIDQGMKKATKFIREGGLRAPLGVDPTRKGNIRTDPPKPASSYTWGEFFGWE